jgi:hypothetical protein
MFRFDENEDGISLTAACDHCGQTIEPGDDALVVKQWPTGEAAVVHEGACHDAFADIHPAAGEGAFPLPFAIVSLAGSIGMTIAGFAVLFEQATADPGLRPFRPEDN